MLASCISQHVKISTFKGRGQRTHPEIFLQQGCCGSLAQRELDLLASLGLAEMAISHCGKSDRIWLGPRYEALKFFDQGESGLVDIGTNTLPGF
ncbi:hypothetical protein I7I53_06028 [Histoplasma capsulatum var. duboisii H88]|uniref:Uncharacterized protein n=1 Tax=Ajellomyces capsulatus (strain H88) TaxID=544711 RepID=A0A8A1LFV7_AJEC8|nr:hypothetical protein I7I53_06028 [Histoplasma capsulatum var. duboisii H88]